MRYAGEELLGGTPPPGSSNKVPVKIVLQVDTAILWSAFVNAVAVLFYGWPTVNQAVARLPQFLPLPESKVVFKVDLFLILVSCSTGYCTINLVTGWNATSEAT